MIRRRDAGRDLPRGPLLVCSPHLDDAVLSLGAALAVRPGSVVVVMVVWAKALAGRRTSARAVE